MTEQYGNRVGKVCGVYKLTFSNGHYYYGQSIDIGRRYTQHMRELRKDIHSNSRITNCYKKYGNPVIEVVEVCNKSELSMVETKYITLHLSDPMCCNVCKEGKSRLGVKASDETRQRVSHYQHISGKTKPVDMFSDNFEYLGTFRSIREGEKHVGASNKDVQKSCKSNGYYRVKGYRFRFANLRMSLTNAVKELIPF